MFSIDLSEKTVLVSGAASGIGLGIATQMAKAGANICGCDISEEHSAFDKAIKPFNVENLYINCDVTNDNQLEHCVQQTIQKFGGIDILISNAGANIFTGAANTTNEDWQKNIELNLTSHWKLSKLCKFYIEKNNGVIIIISSNHAYSSISGCFPYNVAKTALTGLVRSLAIEWGPAIRTVGLAPGFIDTPANQKWFNSFGDPQKERQRTIDIHPVKKLGTTEEIGGWCVFMASEYASFASGTTYLIDGGTSALMQ